MKTETENLGQPANKQELYRRLPELKKIQNTEMRETVEQLFLEEVPAYFWTVPASSTGKHHPKDHAGSHGLWLHTQRAFTAFERLSRSYVNQGKINELERDYGRAAILLHDMFKYGMPSEKGQHTVGDHDVLAARFLERNSDLPDKVIGCVESHNGPEGWGEGRAPRNSLEQVHHLADMIASDQNAFFTIDCCSEVEEVVCFEVNQ